MHSPLSLAVGYNSIVTHGRRSCNNVVAILANALYCPCPRYFDISLFFAFGAAFTLPVCALRGTSDGETMTTPGAAGTRWTTRTLTLCSAHRLLSWGRSSYLALTVGLRPFALPRPDALSPLLNRPVLAAHNTRRYGHPLAGGPGPIG